MKSKLVAIGLFAALGLVSCKHDNASKLFTDAEKQEQASAVVDPATAPVLAFEAETYDFGNLPTGAKVDHYFKFTNTGKSPLIIKDAKGSCGCTVPEFPKQPIAPGATDSIKVTYDAGTQAGRQQKTVTLTTNTVKGKETCTFMATLPANAGQPQGNPVQTLQGS
jgi:hypothetical protein